jgi:hypothetical protein
MKGATMDVTQMTTEKLEAELLRRLNAPIIDNVWCIRAVEELSDRRKAAAW